MLATSTSAPERTSRHASKPSPSPEALRGMQALALSKLPAKARKQHRYGLLAGRLRPLREIGKIAEAYGDQAARQAADSLIEGLASGELFGSRHAAYHAKSLALRFKDIRALYGEARA